MPTEHEITAVVEAMRLVTRSSMVITDVNAPMSNPDLLWRAWAIAAIETIEAHRGHNR